MDDRQQFNAGLAKYDAEFPNDDYFVRAEGFTEIPDGPYCGQLMRKKPNSAVHCVLAPGHTGPHQCWGADAYGLWRVIESDDYIQHNVARRAWEARQLAG